MKPANQLDRLLQDAVEAGDVPGVAAMITDHTDTRYAGAFGRRVLGREPAMTTDTVGWIASMTKALTSTAALQLVERGELQLDQPAAATLPELGEAQVLEGFDGSGRPQLRPARRPITLRHLLTHTAGFGYEMWSGDIVRYQEVTGTPGISSCAEATLGCPLLFEPGDRWCYGINTDWVGKMVEAASGERLGEYLRKNVLGPLHMRDTAFRITPAMRRRLAKVHQRGEDGGLEPRMDLEVPQDPEFEMGGGGLYGTVEDYLKFTRMILNGGRVGGNTVLRPETVDLMRRNQTGDIRVTLLKSALPAATRDAEFFPGVPKSWSLAFQINDQPAPTGLPAGSMMWAGLANSYYWIDPHNGIAGVYMTQILPFVDPKSAPLFLSFQRAAYEMLN